jgi:hypothetical protein
VDDALQQVNICATRYGFEEIARDEITPLRDAGIRQMLSCPLDGVGQIEKDTLHAWMGAEDSREQRPKAAAPNG